MTPVRRAATVPLLALAFALAGCAETEGTPAEGGDAGDHREAEAALAADDAARRAQDGRAVARLLPIDPAHVLWFRATTTAAVGSAWTRDVALFASTFATGEPTLESIGLGVAPWDGLRLARGARDAWVILPSTGAGYRAWTPDAAWEDGRDAEEVVAMGAGYRACQGRGRRLGWEDLDAPGGTHRALRTEHGPAAGASGDVARHWFLPEVGLARLEVEVGGRRELLLELVEVGPRGAPRGGYDATSPAALWGSVQAALRRLDVDGVETLLAPALLRRGRRSGADQVRDLVAPGDLRRAPAQADARHLAARVQAGLGDLLLLDARLRGAWRIEGTEATAPATVTVLDAGGHPRPARAVVVLARRAVGAWVWEDLRLEPAG